MLKTTISHVISLTISCVVVNMSEPLSFTIQGIPDKVSTTGKLETTRLTTNINWDNILTNINTSPLCS